jgi:hypothetical protein
VTERTGALVIRAWIESGSLRARVTRTLDTRVRDDAVSVVATPQDVTRIVVEWLDAFIAKSVEGDSLEGDSLEGDGAVTPR